MEELDRDRIELKKLLDRISPERDYSGFLKESFQKEIIKIENQIESILKMKVLSTDSVVLDANEKKTGDVKKLYAINENRLSPEILIENIGKNQIREQSQKTEKSTHKY